MKWKLHGTEYEPPGGGTYTSQVWAKSRAHAEVLMQERGLGERAGAWTDGSTADASEMFRRFMSRRVKNKPRMIEVVHALVWLANLATSSRRQAPVDALGDNGWLHDAVHWLNCDELNDFDTPNLHWRTLVEHIRQVEARVPGLSRPPR